MKPQESRGWSVFWHNGVQRWVLKYKLGATWKQKALDQGIERRETRKAEAAGAKLVAELLTAAGDGVALARPRKASESAMVKDKVDAWLALREQQVERGELAPSTHQNNRDLISKWVVKPTGDKSLGNRPLDTLSVADLRAWVRDLASQRAAATVRNIVSSVRIYLDDCIAERWTRLAQNPARDPTFCRQVPDARTKAGRSLHLSFESACALLSLPGIPIYRRVRYTLAFSTGMRDGELSGLVWQAVHLDAPVPYLEVRQALRVHGKDGKVDIGPTKTKDSVRVMPLHPRAVQVLRWWHREGWALVARKKPTDVDHVLLVKQPRDQPSRPVSAPALRRDLANLELPTTDGTHPLQFRHTRNSFATWLARLGVPLETRQRLLGHRATSVTELHYTATDLDQLAAAVGKLAFPEVCLDEQRRTRRKPWKKEG